MLRGDFHVHTNISPCAQEEATVENFLAECQKAKLTAIGFSNHLWDQEAKPIGAEEWYSNCTLSKVLTLKNQLPKEKNGVRIYFGCETDIHADGTIALTQEHAKCFDYVLIAMSHYHIPLTVGNVDINNAQVMKPIAMKRFVLACNADFEVPTCICHPFLPCGVKNIEEHLRHFSDEDYLKCFSLAKKKGVAIELSSAFIDRRPSKYAHFDESGFVFEYVRLMKAAQRSGVKIQLGSDAHSLDQFHVHEEMIRFAQVCGIAENELVSEIRCK
ncbi:MAG: PHP domain-containing protein [Bacilli bacterium]